LIPITQEMRISAKAHADERLKYEFDRFGLDNKHRLSMIALGTIGQIVFKTFLEMRNIEHQFQMQAGKFDDFDFVIGNKIIEVKTSGHGGGDSWKQLNAIYNSSQLKFAIKKNYFCSVQIFIDGYNKSSRVFNLDSCNSAIIAGWIEIDKISQTKPIPLALGPAHLISLKQLHEIDTLLTR